MTSLINGNVDCQPVSTLKADILNITYAYKLHSWSLELCGNNAHYGRIPMSVFRRLISYARVTR